jgi:hypothetical protein
MLVVVAVICTWLAIQRNAISERQAIFRMLDERGGCWRSPANLMFPGPAQPYYRTWLGDVPLQRRFYLGHNQGFTDNDLQRIHAAFPEADTIEIIQSDGIPNGLWNSAEPWPTVEQNRREASHR